MTTPNDVQNPLAKLDGNASSFGFHLRDLLQPLVPALEENADSAAQDLNRLIQKQSNEFAALRASRAREDEATGELREREDEATRQRRETESAGLVQAHTPSVSQAKAAAAVANARRDRTKGAIVSAIVVESTEGMGAAELGTPAQRVFTRLAGLLARFHERHNPEAPASNDEECLELLAVLDEFEGV